MTFALWFDDLMDLTSGAVSNITTLIFAESITPTYRAINQWDNGGGL